MSGQFNPQYPVQVPPGQQLGGGGSPYQGQAQPPPPSGTYLQQGPSSFHGTTPSSAISRGSTDPPATPHSGHFGGDQQARFSMRAAWVADSHSQQCMLCAENFGLTRRRHHCRACGTLCCHDCSRQTSRVVPGYEPEAVRICRPCFIHTYSYLVVWHSWFSYGDKLVSGEEKARVVYGKLSADNSRIMVRMCDGCVIESWFKNDLWQQKIVNRVQAQRRELMAQANHYQAPPPPTDFVPATPDSVFIPRTPLPVPAGSEVPTHPPASSNNGAGYIPPLYQDSVASRGGATTAGGGGTTVPPSVVEQQSHLPPSVSRTHQSNSTFLNCFVAYRNKSKDDSLLYSWIDVRSEPDMPDTLQTVKGIMERAGVVQAALIFGPDRRTHYCYEAEGNQESFAAEAEEACREAPVVIAWQVMDGSQMTRVVKWSEVPQVQAHLDKRLPSVVLSMHGNLLAYKNCSVSTLDVISRTAGAAIISGSVVVLATAVMDDPNSVRLFDSAFLAHKQIRDDEHGLLFACLKSNTFSAQVRSEEEGKPQYTVNLLAAHPSISLTDAMVQFQVKISDMLDASKNGVSGQETVVGGDQKAGQQASKPNSRTKDGIPVHGPFSQGDADEEARRELLSCPICIELYTVEDRRPCICGDCGNSICLGCISSLRQCPYCRHDFASKQKAITNIALLGLVEAAAKEAPSRPAAAGPQMVPAPTAGGGSPSSQPGSPL